MTIENGNLAAKLRVLLVEDDTYVAMALKQQLAALGHEVVADVATADEAIARFTEIKPDLVLLDIHLEKSARDGLALASELLKIHRRPMIVISAFGSDDLIARATDAGVFGYLIKPVRQDQLSAQIEVVRARFKENEALFTENAKLTQSLENRKLVERAKGVFMKRLSLSEEDAHRRLQMESQKRRISIVDLAKRILESEELLSR